MAGRFVFQGREEVVFGKNHLKDENIRQPSHTLKCVAWLAGLNHSY